MATGERTFNTSSVTIPTFDKTPVPAGTYELKLKADKAEARKAKTSGVTYVTAPFVAIGSGNGGPDKWVWQRFDLSLKPGKNGATSLVRPNSIVALTKAAGEETSFTIVSEEDVTGATIDILDPLEVVRFLQAQDGRVFAGRVRVEPGSQGYGPKSVIASFDVPESSAGPE